MCLTVYSAVVDFVLAFLPWPLIWGLRMRRREKIGVAVAMSMGVLYVACASDASNPGRVDELTQIFQCRDRCHRKGPSAAPSHESGFYL